MSRSWFAILAQLAFVLSLGSVAAVYGVEPGVSLVSRLVPEPPVPSLMPEDLVVESSSTSLGTGDQDGVIELIPDPTVYVEEAAPYETSENWYSGLASNWRVQIDALSLRRTYRAGNPLVNGATPYGVGDLDLPFRMGPRVSVYKTGLFGSPWDAELTYFDVDGWQTTPSSAGATTFFTTPNINFGARTVASTYSSALYSTELNARRRIGDRYTVITGFRWIELRDNLFTDLVGASHNINVNNHLYGYQLGGDARLFSYGALDVNTWAKAGIYGNSADQSTNIVGIGGAVPSFGASGGHVAFAGEIGLNSTLWVTNWLGVRAGYQALWLDGMATAPSQIAPSDVATGVSALDFSDTLLLHGGYVGVEMDW